MVSPAAVTRGVMSVGLVGMGVLHLVPRATKQMAAIVPPRLRGRGLLSPKSLVRFTGVCEIAGAVGLLDPHTRVAAGSALIAYFAAVFPANVYASQHPERFGAAAVPFWPRLGGQVALVGLTAFAAFPLARRR